MKNMFSGFRGGIVWVILAVLVVAVSLTAQAPKTPTPSQSTSEVGRYTFWSTPIGGDEYKYGFLDTKRGRVWIRVADSLYSWIYYDLNGEATSYITLYLLKFHQRQFGADTAGYRKKIREVMDEAERTTREKEK